MVGGLECEADMSAHQKANEEIELKFLFEPKALPFILESELLSASLAKGKSHRLDNAYFDTDKHDLGKKDIGLRIRTVGEKKIQTLKQGKADSLDRGEWEVEVTLGKPDVSLVAAPKLKTFLNQPKIKDRLQKIFEIKVVRLETVLDLADATIEIALDQGQVELGDCASGICELELELKSGTKQALFGFARELVEQVPLRLSLVSKLEHGARLLKGSWGRPQKPSKVELTAAMPAGQAFAAICLSCLHDFELNMLAFQSSEKVEAVHQARVSMRRLRSLFGFFKPLLEPEAAAALQGELKWITGLLGTARDFDVAIEMIFGSAIQAAQIPSGKEFFQLIETKREAAHLDIFEAINSLRFKQFLISFVSFLELNPFQGPTARLAQKPVTRFARKELKKKYKKLVSQGKGLADLDPVQRHEFRINAKKLRYIAEFFEHIPEFAPDPRAFRVFIKQLETIQENLGKIRDQEAIADFVQEALLEIPHAQEYFEHQKADEETKRGENPRDWLAFALKGNAKLKKCNAF